MDAKPPTARANANDRCCNSATLVFSEVELADGSVSTPQSWRPAGIRTSRSAAVALANGRQPPRLASLMHTPHDARPISAVGRQECLPYCVDTADETEPFRSTFENGHWHWSYHDPRGRLLARGAECSDRWAAHRELLAAIADYCTGGDPVEDDDEEDPPPPAGEEPPFGWP